MFIGENAMTSKLNKSMPRLALELSKLGHFQYKQTDPS